MTNVWALFFTKKLTQVFFGQLFAALTGILAVRMQWKAARDTWRYTTGTTIKTTLHTVEPYKKSEGGLSTVLLRLKEVSVLG